MNRKIIRTDSVYSFTWRKKASSGFDFNGCWSFRCGFWKKLCQPPLQLRFFIISPIHDDIMDDAPLRRGNETVHEKWNINTESFQAMRCLFWLTSILRNMSQQSLRNCKIIQQNGFRGLRRTAIRCRFWNPWWCYDSGIPQNDWIQNGGFSRSSHEKWEQ